MKTNSIKVRLDDQEYEDFIQKKEKTNLDTSKFLRQIIANKEVKEKINLFDKNSLFELRKIGHNINQAVILLRKTVNNDKQLSENFKSMLSKNIRFFNEHLVNLSKIEQKILK